MSDQEYDGLHADGAKQAGEGRLRHTLGTGLLIVHGDELENWVEISL